ncbi:MAG: HAMP domain-containing histidine kinase [Chloroflexi bacterium]|nr:HAMP domain-containing histidine kinase [Chloroflexota bacterium]
MRSRFFRTLMMGCVSLVILSIGGASLLFWVVAGAVGTIDPTGTLGGGALLLGLGFGVLGVALTLRAVKAVARPLGDVIAAAGRVESGDYTVRVEERGSRSVRSLARSFNAMAARLEGSEEQRRRLLADVSHELRTPLSVVQGNLEAILDGVYPADEAHLAPVLEETKVLSRLVEDLRTLSLAEAGTLQLHRELADLDALVRDIAQTFQVSAADAGVELTASGTLPRQVDLDPVRIREVVVNLVANALRYTPRGGHVRIETRLEGADAIVTVADDGSGIAPDVLPHVFERFVKSAESRGAGLGLAIAKGIVTAHGGQIDAESELGRGTRIRFTLPAGSA